VNKIENKEFRFCFGQTKSKQNSKNILIKFDLLNFIKNNLLILNIHGCDFLHQIYMEYNSYYIETPF
jgi:hypothetical protein